MYKKITIISITVILLFTKMAFSQPLWSNTQSSGLVPSCLGDGTKAMGNYSFAAGKKSEALNETAIALGYYSYARGFKSMALGQSCESSNQAYSIGQNAKAFGEQTIAIGRFVQTSPSTLGAIVIGSTNYELYPLVNNISNSLMVGFQSDKPTLFVGPTDVGETSGKVGIGTVNPLGTLHVNGDSYFSKNVIIGINDVNANLFVNSLRAKSIQVVAADANGKLILLENQQVPGDNLGNHSAEMNIYLGEFGLAYDKSMDAGLKVQRDNTIYAKSLMTHQGKRVVITDETGTLSYTDDFNGIPGDNLGNHVATQDLVLGSFGLKYSPEKLPALTIDLDDQVVIKRKLKTPGVYGPGGIDLDLAGGTYPNSSQILIGAGYYPGNEYIRFNAKGTNSYHLFKINDNIRLVIEENEIIVGTSTLKSDLKVNGKIHSNEVIVSLAQFPWPDYVFNSSYELKSLKQVEEFITNNNHLPGIPSANEIKANGINVGEMDALLLQKIEEMTLYLIELQKITEAQSLEIENLKSKLNAK